MRSPFEWLRRIYNRPLLRSVALLSGSTAAAQGLTVLVAPLLARLYTPEDFGLLGVFVSIFSILVAINSLRYELAIPLPEEDSSAAHLTVLVILLVIITTVLFGLLLLAGGDALFAVINAPQLSAYSGLLLICLLGAGFYLALNYWAARRKFFSAIARTKVSQGVSLAGTQVLFGLLGWQPLGLLLGYKLGQITGCLALARLIWQRDADHFRQVNAAQLREVAVRYRRFPLLANWSSLLNVIGAQLPVIMLTVVYGTQVSGWFSLGQRLIALPMTLVGASIGQVYFSTASDLARQDPVALNRFFNRTARRLFWLGLLPMLVIALSGPGLFALVLGEEWRAAGSYVQIMAPMFWMQFVVSSLSQNIYVLEWQGIQFAWDGLRLLVLFALFGLAIVGHYPVEWLIAGYSAAMFALYGLLYWLNKRGLHARMRKG
ncbi:MAG: oligosaccharide flippase family protein [Anaerolineae bacterium]|nr:oligosaccharide flippase family protein [Anaerolineae bacterium]